METDVVKECKKGLCASVGKCLSVEEDRPSTPAEKFWGGVIIAASLMGFCGTLLWALLSLTHYNL